MRNIDIKQLQLTRIIVDRLKAALDATIGALRSESAQPAETQGSATDNNKDDIAEQWRIRGYDRPFDVDEEPVERPQVFKRPAWVRTKVSALACSFAQGVLRIC